MSDSNVASSDMNIRPGEPRGSLVLGWLGVAVVAAVFIWLQSNKAADGAATGKEGANLVVLELRLRIAVGAFGPLTAQGLKTDSLIDQAIAANRAGIDQRLRAIIVLGHLVGPQRASDELKGLAGLIAEAEHQLTEDESKYLGLAKNLYDDYVDGRPEAPLLNPDDRKAFARHFGWFGELALHPKGQPGHQAPVAAAERTFTVVTIAGYSVIGAFTIGFIFLILLCLRRPRSRLGPPVIHHAIYIETFAVWLGLYLLLLFAFPRLTRGMIPFAPSAIATMLLSLSALAWPVVRGIRWKQVRADIGLNFGEQPFLEPSYGIFSYFLALPFLGLGILTTLLLTKLTAAPVDAVVDPFAADSSMAHPLIDQIAKGTPADWLPLLLLACFFAPLVEEIMFRGVLYRHLRDWSRSWKWLSFVGSMLIVNTLFAIVHPQGVLAAPMLAGLACGFVIARERRGSLVASVIAHGLNNTLVLTMLLLMVR